MRVRYQSMPIFRTLVAGVFAAMIASAAVPETVRVGSPGNPADSNGFGAVPYEYRIGKFEVTNGVYCGFLNAVARNDPHALYDTRMAGETGGIVRSGSPGRYSYSVKDGRGRWPVNFVTVASCARYANWLSNGGGNGGTERGSYTFRDGSFEIPDHAALARGTTTKWVLASEDEWYKAAYYDPAAERYWRFPGGSDSAPKANLNSGAPTAVGAHGAASPSGTFDQGGNVWEFVDTRSGGKFGLRGGSFYINDHAGYMAASTRYDVLSAKWPNYGFRVVALGTGRSRPAPQPAESVPAETRTVAKTFYISRSEGNDAWDGESPSRKGVSGPWKTLARASIEYIPGDRILLRRGDTWNEELRPRGSGVPGKPIMIAAYGDGPRPVIDREDDTQDRNGIRLSDQCGFKITGIEFNRCMTGIYADYSDGSPTRKYIWIEDCYFHDSLHYQHYEDYPKRKIGLGICFFSYERDNKVVLEDIMIKACVFRRLASGVWTNSPDNFNKNASHIYNFANLIMDDCLFEEGYQWQQGIRGVDGGVMRRCVTHDIGRGFRSFNGVAGSMFFRCKDWVFVDCEWGFIDIGLGSGDGQAFDFEGNCDNMMMSHCLFHDTDGPGFLLCCYASDGHPHTGILMENCVINGKSKRPIGLPRCAIVNTTDWNESTWKNCRFYLSPGEALMRVMDPEQDKRTKFVDCLVQDLSQACATSNLALEAKATASSEAAGHGAASAHDDNPDSAWVARSATGEWIQFVFPRPQTVNEIRLKEASSSSILRYEIQYADTRTKTWVSCFNGREIGADFVAPIVSRKTSGFRLRILQTRNGNPGIAEFAAYNGKARPFNDPDGVLAGKTVGK